LCTHDVDTSLEKDALNRFGELLVTRVRDESIGQWVKILHGRE